MSNPWLNISKAATDKFWHLDRQIFRLSPYLTDKESYAVLDQMELAAASKYEGNWTESDTFQFLQDVLGKERLQLIEMMYQADQATAVANVIGKRKQ